MSIDFKKQNNEEIEIKDENIVVYDINKDREQLTDKLSNSQEIEELTSQIEVYNLDTIVSFGANAAEEVSKCSDIVLNSMNMKQIDDSSEMLNTLAKIMEKFDINEIKENKGLFGKLFTNMKKQIDKIINKYHTMGEEVDKIYINLKQYESEIKQSNRKLEDMFQANVGYYHELIRYIVAGEKGINELESYIEQKQKEMEQTIFLLFQSDIPYLSSFGVQISYLSLLTQIVMA